MKTKLLKKLRKKAKSFVWLEEWPWRGDNRYVIRKENNIEMGTYWYSCGKLEEAVKLVNDTRRDWILRKVRDLGMSKGKYRKG